MLGDDAPDPVAGDVARSQRIGHARLQLCVYSPDIASSVVSMTKVGGPLSIREQQRAFTRRRLMEVAQQLFAAQGYPETTVDDIARAAGASRATFYLHFKSKAELMGSAIDAAVPMAVETYHVLDEQLADGGPQLPSRLRGWLAEWVERWTDGPQASHATLQATMLEPEVEMHYLRLSEALVDSLVGYFDRMPAGART